MSELRELFEMIEPPAGGLARLQARIEGNQRRVWRRRTRWAAGVLGVLLVLGATSVLRRRVPPLGRPDTAFDPALVRLGLQDPPSQPAVVPAHLRNRMVLERIQSRNEGVVLYRLHALDSLAAGAPEG